MNQDYEAQRANEYRIRRLEERVAALELQLEQRKLSEWNTSMSGKLDLPSCNGEIPYFTTVPMPKPGYANCDQANYANCNNGQSQNDLCQEEHDMRLQNEIARRIHSQQQAARSYEPLRGDEIL